MYDSYELVSVGHVIDRHIMALPSLGGSRGLTNQISHSSTLISSKQGASGFGMGKGSSFFRCFSEFFEKIAWKKRRVNG